MSFASRACPVRDTGNPEPIEITGLPPWRLCHNSFLCHFEMSFFLITTQSLGGSDRLGIIRGTQEFLKRFGSCEEEKPTVPWNPVSKPLSQ